MTFVKIMIHAVWGTKMRFPFLTKEIKSLVIKHIKEDAKTKGIYIDSLNGAADHLHCLFGLNTDMSNAKAMKLIKGESAYWINKKKLTKTKFDWADEYYSVSVSESILPIVRAYIQNQEEHHKKKTFMQEHDEFLNKYEVEGHN